MNQLPALTTEDLCDLYPNQADVIGRFINEPGLMPYEITECVICGADIESPTRNTCSQECRNAKQRQKRPSKRQ